MKKVLFLFLIIYLYHDVNSQELPTERTKVKYIMSGIISDSVTGETLPYATIFIQNSGIGVTSNKYGFYSLTLEKGKYWLAISYLGYKTKKVGIDLNRNIRNDFQLTPSYVGIYEVTIKSVKRVGEFEQRLSKIEIQRIKELPSLGEADIMNSLQHLPGITRAAEIGGGFNVRGGAVDQNLVMLDEAIVYNASHMEGFYSVFNADIVKDIKFYKSDFPANFGGRLSSVMDVTQKEGNLKSFHGNGGVSPIATRISFEGPIAKNKASFIISARRSYIDLFFKHAPDKFSVSIQDVIIHFYDINTKLNYIINENNRIYLSSYLGNDVFKFEDYNQEYGNKTTTLRYNHIFNNRLFSNTSLIYSDYNMIDGESGDETGWEDLIGIDHFELKNEFNFYANRNKIRFGFGSIYRHFHPGELKLPPESENYEVSIPNQHALESSVYLGDLISVGRHIELQLGLRYSFYHYLGAEEIFQYSPNQIRHVNTIADTISYSRNEIIKFYNFLEPRMGIKYKLNNTDYIKLSYGKSAQYIHLISNTITPTPYNMWKPSNNNIKPMNGQQISAGYFASFLNNSWEFSFETFYKKAKNTVEIRPGSSIVLNRTLDADLVESHGKVYGFEVLLDKKQGKHTGSVSYTFCRSLRQVDNEYVNEKIFQDEYFPADYDIPNKITVAYRKEFGERSTFSANFLYQSGRPVTLPSGQYFYFGRLRPYYSGKNQHRIPAFHRLDFAYNLEGKKNATRNWKSYWSFSIYNVYGRNNPYSIYLENIDNTRDMQAVQFSVIGNIVPTVAYSFKF